MNPRLTPLLVTAKLNARLVPNCLAGVDEALAQRRPSDATNSMLFIALHLVDVRFYLARLLGAEVESPFQAELADVNRIEDMGEYPALSSVLASWSQAGEVLEERLAAQTDATLEGDCSTAFPIEDGSVLGAVAFLLQHESYHIGQLALLRKFFGLPAMSYE